LRDNRDREKYDSQVVEYAATSKNEKLMEDIWIFETGACEHYCNSSKGMCNVEKIKESIMVTNGKSMMATKVRSLKCRAHQLYASGIDITLH
jgi:hypothetical protein